ncbi:uncharacterized protein LOC112512622 isoform X3 [Cynara cardunculus var. scolymus]|uniref:Leucine-rich repeat-containing protein n=1 Tax=Cynara cardunculus var. scolymus TaxID=59895 RepID=A0A103YEX8_CYNCS|nr:uncharacterized protein LOC112512622 isoform X3 [Cynara cardunculus var. scolymus]KVI07838.1 hypothetical protein Ccrd_013800 [Cynara cardunculus var. scolymus]
MAAIVTGDRYLESLVKFVEKQVGPLIEGTLVLKLNPVGLHYVQSRLESLAELERLLAGAPVDYLRAYVSDLGDHRALEQLRRILRILTSLKVISVLPPPSSRDPTPVCLLPFGRLKVLELRGCDLSTSAARGLLELRHTLEKIICHNSTVNQDALRHVFASRIAEIEDSPQWKRLSFVSCAYNGLVLMDDSLRLLPVVETLDLSRNKFAKVDNLWRCSKLKHLDLGFNQLRTITSFSKVSCQIVKLVLRNNALTTMRGVENLKSLEGLDLSYNIISNFSELELLAGLPSLRSLWLEGNPVCSANWYRPQVYSFFSDPDKLILDGKKISTREGWKRQIIIASRHKQPASFGFYSPAKYEAEAEGEGSVNTKMKKLSRVASIDSEAASIIVYSDNDSGDDEDRIKQEITDSNKGAEIVDFINKLEFMKRERSDSWLEEFQRWMNHVSDDHVKSDDMQSGLALILGKEKDSRKKRRLKHFGKTSRYVSRSAEVFVEGHGMEVPESYYAYDDLSTDTVSQQYPNEVGESASSYLLNLAHEDGSISNHMKLKSHYDKGVDSTRSMKFGEEGTYSNNGSKVEMTSSNSSFVPLDTLDDIIEARSPSAYAGSPPHYQEDILHRRHNLEEEFLQLSAESYSVASSDSHTSDSGDDSFEIGSRIHNNESTADDLSRSMDNLSFIPSEDLHSNRMLDVAQFTKNGSCSLSPFTMNTFNTELRDSEQLGNNYEGSLHDGEIVGLVKQEANWLEKKMRKRKPKPRVISLTEKVTHTDDINDSVVRKSSHKLNYSANDVQEACRREAGMNDFQMLVSGIHSITAKGEILPEKNLSGPGTEEFILKNVKVDLADFGVQETCRQCVCCNCLLEEPSGCSKSGVSLLLSSEHKLYVLLLNGQHDGSGYIPSLVGCLGNEDVKEVLVGLGLQAVRVYTTRGARYMFITRSIEKSRLLISVLELFHSNAKKTGFPLLSLDKIQVALFERDVCGGSKTNILQYTMVLFWNSNFGEGVWFSRSLFVLGGHMLVCIEDVLQFGFDSQDTFTPYFSLDTCCSIVDAFEMVIDAKDGCVTLALKSVASEFIPWDVSERGSRSVAAMIWKLRWFSEDDLCKFVALVKALHAGFGSSSPLIVRYAS